MTNDVRLIADAGSSKVEWAVLFNDGSQPVRFTTPGINALMTETRELVEAFRKASENLPTSCKVSAIYYYGAGCATSAICGKISDALQSVWDGAQPYVESDMAGAARALLGREKGIAAILGTGSNSALYDGEGIIGNIPPLGFILGDEGSGTALGKRLIKEIFKGKMPEELKETFFKEFDISLPEILNKVYKEPAPNKFIASLVPFIRKHMDSPFIHN
ncbi:MAG: ATPase, partial [Muribaculaceae bacterium]|nr:ATPase [Muribaculaceae bacterium]